MPRSLEISKEVALSFRDQLREEDSKPRLIPKRSGRSSLSWSGWDAI